MVPVFRIQPRQPDDVHGASELIDPRAWERSDAGWRGRRWEEGVIYEVHVGAFTPEGTFAAAATKLDHLVSLGITAIEIMPVGDFPGRRNWGYDGVLPYAPDSSYGRPEDLKALVEAAHARGLMVLLDVIYNHFGPDGNYLPLYAPQFFTGDGLRLDAVHAIADDSPVDILQELAERVHAAAGDRLVHLVLENDKNEARRLVRDAGGRPRSFTAQWNDDVHHVLHTAATQESHTYYEQYCGDTDKLGRALAEGFVRARGERSAHLPPSAFVTFIQNHDQIGNRAPWGTGCAPSHPPRPCAPWPRVYLLSPQIPMLFMGEEWNAAQPFPFFCHFDDGLAEAVRRGRRKEFPEHRGQIPDPQAYETFASAKLVWEDLPQTAHADSLDWYRRILRVRREIVEPKLPGIGGHAGRYQVIADGAVIVRWRLHRGELTLEANLSPLQVAGFTAFQGEVRWREGQAGDDGAFGPWSVRWSI
jgi:1,4-alpha-glucan branching enzyme